MLVLRRESATFQRVCSSVLPQQAPAMPTVGPVETPAPDRVAEKFVAKAKDVRVVHYEHSARLWIALT